MEMQDTTFGSFVSARRKAKYLSQAALIKSSPVLYFLSAQELNEYEQDRKDPRRDSRVIEALANALDLEASKLQELAERYEIALARQIDFQRSVECAAVAFRTRFKEG